MVLNVPYARQRHNYTCGPNALEMVARYYGIRMNSRHFWRRAGTTQEKGTTRLGMANAMRDLGFRAFVKQNASLRDIENSLRDRRPVIVNYRDFITNEGHYGVVTGIDEKYVHLHDPYKGPNVRVPRREFLRRWRGSNPRTSNRWLMVCSPDSPASG